MGGTQLAVCTNDRCPRHNEVREIRYPQVGDGAWLVGPVLCSCGWDLKTEGVRFTVNVIGHVLTESELVDAVRPR